MWATVGDSVLLLLMKLFCWVGLLEPAVLQPPRAAAVHANCMEEHNTHFVKGARREVRGRLAVEPAWRSSGNPTLTDAGAAPLQSVLMHIAAVKDNRMVGRLLGSLQKTQCVLEQ